MKVQWQLINIDTGKILATMGKPFDIESELIEYEWIKQFQGKVGERPIGLLGFNSSWIVRKLRKWFY